MNKTGHKQIPHPILLIAGDRGSDPSSNYPLLRAFFDKTGKKEPSVAYIGAASNDNKEFFSWIKKMMQDCGAGNVALASTIGRSKEAIIEFNEIVEHSDAIFLSGGDVEAGMLKIEKKGLLPLLVKRYREGAFFFGVSAGSIMLGSQWIRWRDPQDDTTAERFACMNIAPIICDTHDEENGWEELHAMLSLCDTKTTGYGIPSGSGLWVLPDGKVHAIGKPVWHFVNNNGVIDRRKDIDVSDF